jgi:hypothetical protein
MALPVMSDAYLIIMAAIDFSTGLGAALYAWKNRYGLDIDDIPIVERMGETYRRISPYIDHFCMGYAMASFGHGASNIMKLTAGQGDDPLNIVLYAPILFTVGSDLMWERYRGRLSQGRFVATWAGIMASVAVNNIESMLDYIS